MKLFSNLDLIIHHIREVSCLSFPGTQLKRHCALWRVYWLCIMLRLKDFPVMVWFYDLFQNCYPTLSAISAINPGFSSSSPLPTSHMPSRSKYSKKQSQW